MQPIKGHKFSEFIVSLSVRFYINLNIGLRGVVKILSILKETLNWEFEAVPNFNTIENWVKKSGYAIYKEPSCDITSGDYAMITDESMMIGSEKMLLTLGIKADKENNIPICHQDVEVMKMSVQPSWNSENIEADLKQTATEIGHPPKYAISDNVSSITKAIKSLKYPHIRDISHTLGMFMERIYKNDEQFISYMKEISMVKSRECMNKIAYLLPPKQRSIARFLNLSAVADGSCKMLEAFKRLTKQEQKIFAFIPKYASFIENLLRWGKNKI